MCQAIWTKHKIFERTLTLLPMADDNIQQTTMYFPSAGTD